MLFTTSWDDGHPRDLAVAELLERYGCTGTFYVGPKGFCREALTSEQINLLAKRHEIGAHTLTHPSLPTVSAENLDREIRGSKEWVEKIIGRECTMFAYPFGHFNSAIRDKVAGSGFRGARTTQDLSWDLSDPFMLPTSVQIHYFPFRPILNRRFVQPIVTNWSGLRAAGVPLVSCFSWLSMAKAAFVSALKNNQRFFHLWGHSWALDRERKWGVFEEFLRFIVSHKNIQPVQNSSLIAGTSR